MQPGPGCSSTCEIETGYACFFEPSMCEIVPCGDGIVDDDRGCDDGNTLSGDGCSEACEVEPGWGCFIDEGGGSVCDPEVSLGTAPVMRSDFPAACSGGM